MPGDAGTRAGPGGQRRAGGVKEMAVNVVGRHRRPAADAARDRAVVSWVQAAPPFPDSSAVPPWARARSGPRPGAAASASGTSARPAWMRLPAIQCVPSSLVVASGENVRSTPGRNPASSERPSWPARTRPPLVATPGGVTSFHALLPAGRTNSCPKALLPALEPPITMAAQVPPAVTAEVSSDGLTAGGLTGAWWLAADPQPAMHAAAAVAAASDRARPGADAGEGLMASSACAARRRTAAPRMMTSSWRCPGRDRRRVPGGYGRNGR